jgi:hypothetical protein
MNRSAVTLYSHCIEVPCGEFDFVLPVLPVTQILYSYFLQCRTDLSVLFRSFWKYFNILNVRLSIQTNIREDHKSAIFAQNSIRKIDIT